MRIIEFITQEEFERISDIFSLYPALTYNIPGYGGLDKSKFTKEESLAFKEVEDLLRKTIDGFAEFQNFTTGARGTGPVRLRFQYNYGYDGIGIHFKGVGYIKIGELLNGFEEKEK